MVLNGPVFLFLVEAADFSLSWHFDLSCCCPEFLFPSEAEDEKGLIWANRCCAIGMLNHLPYPNIKIHPFKKYPQALFSTFLTAVEMLCFPIYLVVVTSKDISHHP